MDALFQFLKRLVAPVVAFISGLIGYYKGKADAENSQRAADLEAAKLRNRVETQLDRSSPDDIGKLRNKWTR